MKRHCFTIFISGSCTEARHAVNNLRFLCERYLKNNHEIKIVDVDLSPEAAEANGIMVTPTLIKKYADEEFRVFGDLSRAEEVFEALGLETGGDWPIANTNGITRAGASVSARKESMQ